MNYLPFLINSCLLGIGLAMDEFSVSLANGLNQPSMKQKEEVKNNYNAIITERGVLDAIGGTPLLYCISV